ncbi:putative histidinol phosphatase and related hydrolases of the PHP family [Lachnospiraceae bacterium KM106-2]|nr:putative histidinol phosphatase and related hydrolases of the PHP family [Lachnospiraceae bacterium KM106-2]
MKLVLDTHTHTIASGHAYNTINEMVLAARDKQLELLSITEHSMTMPGTCHEFYFQNLRVIPREMHGVKLLLGTELNIIDYHGNVDMDESLMKQLDIRIASLHGPCIKPGTIEQNTNAVLGAIKNPYVNIIGHPDDGQYPLDYEAIVKAAKEHHVMIEVNNSSIRPGGFRLNSRENALKYVALCKQYEVPISLGSDAHYTGDILNYEYALDVLKEIDFPEELVMNTNTEKFLSYLHSKK